MSSPTRAPRRETRHPRYEMVVGLTAHIRLRTTTKAFCNCAVDLEDAPNANICPVCLGLPGTLPVLSIRAVEQGVRASLALCCTVASVSEFARRHRFAPDLPKGYQITQDARPLATRGHVQIGETLEGTPITVAVTRVCLEEEPGRAVHDRFPHATALDDNRAGAPALHVASAPAMRSSAEAVAYVRGLRRLVRGVGAGDVRLEDGTLRVRATLSVRRLGDTALGTPCEVAGAGSLGALRAALDAEFARQCALADAGQRVEQRTMLWDATAGALVPSLVQPRARAADPDPHCLPEPDLPPLVLTSAWIAEQRAWVPARPTARREHLAREYKLDGRALDVLTADPDLADYYESVARAHGDARTAATWLMDDVLDVVDGQGVELDTFALRVRPADLAQLLDMVRDGKLGPTSAKHVFGIMVRTGHPPARVAQRERLWPVPEA